MTTARVEGLVQRRGRRAVLHDVSFTLGAGVTGLLGPNGAGKTTLLETLVTLIPPVDGDVTVLGHTLGTRTGRREVRRRVGFLPQRFGYHPGFTVSEFLTYVAWTKGLDRQRTLRAVDDAMSLVDLEEQAGTRMRKLSGGMLQRAGIAATLVHGPELLVLDEPTVGLDPRQRAEFRRLIRQLADTTPVLLSTHLTDDVNAMCTSVLVLAEGNIAFQGTPQTLADAGGAEDLGDNDLERGYNALLYRDPAPRQSPTGTPRKNQGAES
ncbi:ATP-binding cassette domain-containing protein [Streptomyces sp. A0958]|uniref:ATP-binding cassette domain-containing protein n=1 Tax=Streptomyces sp. A0958 TaxID=2563101 RepID=UPI00109ED654|nr:ATP-binding cassette domain-containing protein [Streptomyces sp. A0958]THA70678.1 ATP-binding cassette domain-containing protein [Streptomyces sp. A0958]